MPYTPPIKIKINSDENILEFTKIIKEKTENKYQYVYTKSFSKLGSTICFSELELSKYLKNNVFKEI